MGGINVRYYGESEEVLVSADDLVGARPNGPSENERSGEGEESPKKRPPKRQERDVSKKQVSSRKEEQSKELAPSERQKTQNQVAQENPQKEYCGIYQVDDGCYVRGNLRNDIPNRLVAGEIVRYSAVESVGIQLINSRFQVWDDRNKRYNDATSVVERKICQNYAKLAEEKHADAIRERQLNRKRASRSTFLNLRPLQPIIVEGKGEAIVTEPPDGLGSLKVQYIWAGNRTSRNDTIHLAKVKLVGHSPEPTDQKRFFQEHSDIPKQRASYREPPDFLVKAWTDATGGKLPAETCYTLTQAFNKLVEERKRRRLLADPQRTDGTLSAKAAHRLEERVKKLHKRLKKDFARPQCDTSMDSSDFKEQIIGILHRSLFPNFLLLCGGIAPEITAYKRLAIAPPGIVVVQDTDLHAVGVAVAAHPDVHFAIVCEDPKKEGKSKYEPGDVRTLSTNIHILREVVVSLGGIHNIVRILIMSLPSDGDELCALHFSHFIAFSQLRIRVSRFRKQVERRASAQTTGVGCTTA